MLDEEGRAKIIEMMWEIVYADGERDELEDNLLWRAADLLGVSPRERIELRQRIAKGRRARGLTRRPAERARDNEPRIAPKGQAFRPRSSKLPRIAGQQDRPLLLPAKTIKKFCGGA